MTLGRDLSTDLRAERTAIIRSRSVELVLPVLVRDVTGPFTKCPSTGGRYRVPRLSIFQVW